MGAEISLLVKFSGDSTCSFLYTVRGKKKPNNVSVAHSCVHREKDIVLFRSLQMTFVMGVK